MLQLFLERRPSPVGEVIIGTDDKGVLRVLDFADYEARMGRLLQRQYGANGFSLADAGEPSQAASVLGAYFEGDLKAIERLKTANGGTQFQRKVWAALRSIPARATITYGALAARLGLPRAARAVGLANGANPIAIVVPCHRVIGANGALTGYGGGIARKRWLLAHEAEH
ncbi:MAG: methylated-DNA--[protein]-cysteine S-methyltransferase [Rhizomicrobium sp.]